MDSVGRDSALTFESADGRGIDGSANETGAAKFGIGPAAGASSPSSSSLPKRSLAASASSPPASPVASPAGADGWRSSPSSSLSEPKSSAMEACAAIVGEIVKRLPACGASVRRSVSCNGNWSVPCVSIQLTLSLNLSLFPPATPCRRQALKASLASHLMCSTVDCRSRTTWSLSSATCDRRGTHALHGGRRLPPRLPQGSA